MSDVHEAYPYLRVHNTNEAIAFYARAFGASELFRLTAPSGRIGHEWLIGSQIEDVSTEEMQRRYTVLLAAS